MLRPMDVEEVAIVLGVSCSEAIDLAAALGIDPDDIGPDELVEMAELLDEDEEDDD